MFVVLYCTCWTGVFRNVRVYVVPPEETDVEFGPYVISFVVASNTKCWPLNELE